MIELEEKGEAGELPVRRPALAEVVIAEDHPLLLRGLLQVFSSDDRFRVVATAADGELLLAAIERFLPDVVVTGWRMPHLDGEGVLRALRDRAEKPRVVVYSGLEDPAVPARVLALGGAGFCSKRAAPEELLETVAAVAAGRMVFPYLDASRADPMAALTARERAVLDALAGGRTVKELARDLGLSPNTLKFHIKNVYDKLGVKSRAEAVTLYLSGRSPR